MFVASEWLCAGHVKRTDGDKQGRDVAGMEDGEGAHVAARDVSVGSHTHACECQ